MATPKLLDSTCSIARSLGVLGERWTFLILREAFSGSTRFAQFKDALGIAPDVLTARLATLVEYGAMTREPYQEPGSRPRDAYHLTEAGLELRVVIGALQQWGDRHVPYENGPTIERRVRGTDQPVHVAFVDDSGTEVPLHDVAFNRTASYPGSDRNPPIPSRPSPRRLPTGRGWSSTAGSGGDPADQASSAASSVG